MALFATALACLTAAAAPGCGPKLAEAQPPAERFAISYERGGGFAPVPHKLVIRPGRRASLTVREYAPPRAATVDFPVSKRRVEGLRRALARADFQSIESPGPDSGCSDCFLYEIRHRGHEVAFDDVSMPGRLRGVVDRLEAIVEAHRPFH